MIFQGIEHEEQRLYVHWDITTKCNFKCNYCYAIQGYGDAWGNENSKKTIDGILSSIKVSSLPIFLGLLGGEPTMSIHYDYIINELNSWFFDKNDRNRLYVTTNLSKPMSYWVNHPKIKNTFILASFHPEYHDEKSIIVFIDKLKYLNKYFRVKVNIMLDPKYHHITSLWPKYLRTLDEDIIIHPHIIYPDGSPFNSLDSIYQENYEIYKDIFQFMNPEYIFEENGKKQHLKDIDVFSKKMNSFKGWMCSQNNYEILYNGDVLNLCFHESKTKTNNNINTSNLIKDPLFFKRIRRITPKQCIQDFCNCDGLLKCKKVKK